VDSQGTTGASAGFGIQFWYRPDPPARWAEENDPRALPRSGIALGWMPVSGPPSLLGDW